MKKFISGLLVVLLVFTLSGCGSIDNWKVKLGLKNNDFEYIKEGKIRKILIQNTRDKGFSFNVTDSKAISDLYNILSTAKEVKEKTSLKPDYTFEMQESATKSYKFSYVAGIDNEALGNLYSDNKIYIVSKRLDDDIIKNFWTIRKPTDFKTVYYSSILQTLKEFIKDNKTKSIGIDIDDDINSSRFILSTDLQEFSSQLKQLGGSIELQNTKKDYDVVLSVNTEGYMQNVYKAVLTFENIKDNTEKVYYIMDDYFQNWNYKITPDTKPWDF